MDDPVLPGYPGKDRVSPGAQVLREFQPLRQPRRLAGALGVVGLGPRARLGDPGGDEAEQRRALGNRRFDHLAPALQSRAAGDLVRAVGAPARVGGPERVVPGADPAHEPPARGDDLRAVLEHVAGELDLVEDPARPVREVPDPAGVDAGAAWVGRRRVDPPAGTAVGWRPGEPGERAGAVRAQELVGDHGRFHSRKAASSLSRVWGGTSASVMRPTVATVERIWS